jgi:small conductance mechanosensitive channel
MFSLTAFLSALAGYLTAALIVLALLALAAFVAFNSQRIARWMVGFGRVVPRFANDSAERRQTLIRLYASVISTAAIVLVLLGILRLFVDSAQIIWIIGLFSAAFGLGARGLVADIVAGATYIFRNTFSIGEKVEFTVAGNKVEGRVEDVNLRSTLVRALTGELFTVPNGEISIIRNFSRSIYSGTVIKLNIPTAQLATALEALSALGKRAPELVPELIAPWQLLVTNENVGATTEVTLSAQFEFGKAAPLKGRLISAIDTELLKVGVRLDPAAEVLRALVLDEPNALKDAD